jgi:hypothetical protein
MDNFMDHSFHPLLSFRLYGCMKLFAHSGGRANRLFRSPHLRGTRGSVLGRSSNGIGIDTDNQLSYDELNLSGCRLHVCRDME